MLVILINVVHVAAYLEKLGWLDGDELEVSQVDPEQLLFRFDNFQRFYFTVNSPCLMTTSSSVSNWTVEPVFTNTSSHP